MPSSSLPNGNYTIKNVSSGTFVGRASPGQYTSLVTVPQGEKAPIVSFLLSFIFLKLMS